MLTSSSRIQWYVLYCLPLAGGMKIVFVNLDPSDPDRIFYIIIDVVDDKVWNSK